MYKVMNGEDLIAIIDDLFEAYMIHLNGGYSVYWDDIRVF